MAVIWTILFTHIFDGRQRNEVSMKTVDKISKEALTELIEEKALDIRRDIVKMISLAASGHPGGSLSAVEIISVLYFYAMRHDSMDPKWSNRDRFVLSKGHSAPALYAVLAEAGYFDRAELWTFRKLGSRLQGHPDMRKLPGVDMSTGSLGQGLAVANGMAMAAKIDDQDHNIFALIGDGESQEGEIWEAALFASHNRLGNLIAITDFNDLQIDGRVSEIKDICPIDEKWSSFGWHVICVDGHDINELIDAIDSAKRVEDRPVMIEAKTIKGRGVSFMEDNVDWHGKAPTGEELEMALSELGVKEWN